MKRCGGWPRRTAGGAVILCVSALVGLAGAQPPAVERTEAVETEAAGECVGTVAARVQAYYDAVADLRAVFRQSTSRVGFGSVQPSSLEARGEVILAKPSRMRWSYAAPERSEIVSNGSELWIYDPAAGEAQHYVGADAAWLSGVALQFLLGEGDLLRDFAISASGCGEEWVALELVPRSPTNFERIDLVVAASTGEVRETGVVDLLGNRTELRFGSMLLNSRPDPAIFEFHPPPGTRVLEAPAPAGPGEPEAADPGW